MFVRQLTYVRSPSCLLSQPTGTISSGQVLASRDLRRVSGETFISILSPFFVFFHIVFPLSRELKQYRMNVVSLALRDLFRITV